MVRGSVMGFLPDWLQQLADTAQEGEVEIMLDKKMTECNHIYDEHGMCFECDAKAPYDQVAADRRYREKQKTRGIVRKTVLVPETRVKELQAICKQWRVLSTK